MAKQHPGRGSIGVAGLLLALVACTGPLEQTATSHLHGGIAESGYAATGTYLVRHAASGPWSYRCGATLIQPDLAVTAAHCVDTAAVEHALYYGDTVGGVVAETETVHRARVVVIHPRLNWRGSYKNDVAVLILEEAVTDREVARIAAYTLGCGYRAIGNGLDETGEIGHRKSTPYCIESVEFDRGLLNTDVPEGSDFARLVTGDSGGPLYFEGTRDLVGMLSFTPHMLGPDGAWWGQHTALAERREFLDCVDTHRQQWGSGAPTRDGCGICVEHPDVVPLGSLVGAAIYIGSTAAADGAGTMSVEFKDCVQGGEQKYDDYWFRPPPIRQPVAETVFRWTAPQTGDYWFSALATDGSAFDPMLYAYTDTELTTGCMDPRRPLLCNDDRFDHGGGAQVRRHMVGGESIYLVVDGSTWSDALENDEGDWILSVGVAEAGWCLPEGPDVIVAEDFNEGFLPAPAPATGVLHRSLSLGAHSPDAVIELRSVGGGQLLQVHGEATLQAALPSGSDRYLTISQEMVGDGDYEVVAASSAQTAVLFRWMASSATPMGQPPVATVPIPAWADHLELRVDSAPGMGASLVLRAVGVHRTPTPTCAPHRLFVPWVSA